VIGVDREVVQGLDDQGRDLGECFAPVSAVVAADADAEVRLRDARLPTGRWLRFGPTNAVRAPGEETLRYDASRWQVDEEDGALVLTNLAERHTPCRRLATGIRGTVVEPGHLRLDE